MDTRPTRTTPTRVNVGFQCALICQIFQPFQLSLYFPEPTESASIEEEDLLPDVTENDEAEDDDLKSYVDLESGGK